MRTIRFTGEQLAAEVVQALVHRSAHFILMPLPDDEWEVAVRDENADFVGGILLAQAQSADAMTDLIAALRVAMVYIEGYLQPNPTPEARDDYKACQDALRKAGVEP